MTTNAMPLSFGIWPNKACKASTPPAEAPTPTTVIWAVIAPAPGCRATLSLRRRDFAIDQGGLIGLHRQPNTLPGAEACACRRTGHQSSGTRRTGLPDIDFAAMGVQCSG